MSRQISVSTSRGRRIQMYIIGTCAASDIFINLIVLQKVDRNTKVVADNGTEFFLCDVIAHTLSHLKKEVTISLGGAMRPELHIDWVITVPAIWDADGKQMMREAGYKVLFYYYCRIWAGDIDIVARLGQQFHEPLLVNYGIGYS